MDEEDSKSYKSSWSWAREMNISRPATPSAKSTGAESTTSKGSAPRWWRPSYPPKTYYWEEIRRKRQRGGYPWTYLDREMADLSDNLYEPVNPRPYYGSGNIRQDPETTSLDERLIDIPPELDIVTSEGLDGLDQLDAHDYGFDGEKEWNHYPEEMGDAHVPKTFTAGIRKELPKYGETSSERPLMTKTGATEGDQEVPSMAPNEQSASKSSALTQIKQKADQVKKQLSKISLPAAPKFNNWSGLRLSKKKRKTEDELGAEEDEEIFEPIQPPESGTKTISQTVTTPAEKVKPPKPPLPKQAGILGKFFETDASQAKTSEVEPTSEAAEPIRPKTPTKGQDIKAAEKLQKVPERNVVDEEAVEKLVRDAKDKSQRDKSPIDLKRQQKQDEKLAKEKAQEEAKRLKAEEKAAKEKAKEEKRKAEAEDKLLRKKQEEELKKARQDEERKQAEQEAEAKRIQAEQMRANITETKVEQPKHAPHMESTAVKEGIQPSTSVTAHIQLQSDIDLQQRIKEKEIKQQKASHLQETAPAEAVKQEEQTVEAPKEKKPKRTDVFKRKLADIDFTKKFKRSKTPPGRPDEPPRLKYKKSGKRDDDTDNKLAAQYAQEILRRDAEMEIEKGKEKQHRLQEPVIYVTQPSVETADSDPHSTDLRPNPLYYENVPESEVPQKQKFGEKVKGFGQKSKAIASEKSKNIGQKMKVIGHDLKQFGGKVNVKCQETFKEIRATQEAAKKRSREAKEAQAQAQAEAAEHGTDESEKTPRTSFRFKKRPLNDEETVGKPEVVPVVAKSRRKKKPLSQEYHEYLQQHGEEQESAQQQQQQESKVDRHAVLGRADRDWESPLDLIQSREESEEPFSGRYSPPGSSTASSRRQGVLEEIDSDEFFLRERGISEGEDEEEMNRMLMHELRQTFRPLDNSLRGFDMPSPPPRPARSPRKPPRKVGGKGSNFQTFPPERPKRKQTPGYISAYLNQEQERDEELEGLGDQMRMSEEDELMALESDEDEGIRRVKLELRRIDQDMEDEKIRYEPVLTEDSPLKPSRSKRGREKSKEKEPPAGEERPQIFYYNIIGANEWKKKVEAQIEGSGQGNAKPLAPENPPVVPRRVRRKSEGGKSAKSEGGKSGKSETQFSEIDNTAVGHSSSTALRDQEESGSLSVQVDQSEDSSTLPATLDLDVEDSLEYVDYEEDPGGGYAMVVQKKFNADRSLPKTVPRRKSQRGNGRKSHSLKRRSQEGAANEMGASNPVFCSLPRFTPRTFHIVPPTRPHRNYSSLKPKRPPRHHRTELPSHAQQGPSRPSAPIVTRASPRLSARDDFDERDRGTTPTTVGSIQGRPLPPPPRPQRSPGPMNDLDLSTIERMVGLRHYANFVSDEVDGRVPVVEELCVAKNIPLLGRADEDPNGSESNVGVQTDPVQGEEEIDLNAVGSFEDEDDGIDKQRNSVHRNTSSDGQDARHRPPAARVSNRPSSPRISGAAAPPSTEVIFPSRLHLDELEVDFLRVNELTAQSITMDHLHAPQLYVDSMSSSGALIVPLIQSSTLAVDQVNTERVSTTDISSSGTSIPPSSFYQLAASPQMRTTTEFEAAQEIDPTLRLSTQGNVRPGQQFRPGTTPTSDPTQPSTQVVRRNSADDVFRQTVRLGRAILHSAMRGLSQLSDYLDAASSNDPECHAQQRSQIQILLCMLLVLVIGIFLLSGSTSPSPRWEFFLPPPDL